MELTYTDGNLTVTITGTIEDAITILGRSLGFTTQWQPTTEPTPDIDRTQWTAHRIRPGRIRIHRANCPHTDNAPQIDWGYDYSANGFANYLRHIGRDDVIEHADCC